MTETPSSSTISTRLQSIASRAKDAPALAFTTLAHHIDIELLREAHRRTRKSGATGVDGVTAQQYAVELESNLERLRGQMHAGTYRAPPVRRVHIPKGDGTQTRPIGIPAFEDKVLQRAVAMVLEAIYEQDFMDCSYGFRPGRSAHQALESLRAQMMAIGRGWIVEVDIRKFFDTLDHAHLREILRQRIRDGVLLRLISKWLHAGVMESGALSFPDAGTPQGGVISPLLANVYLHEVLDTWFERDVQPRLLGRAFLVRYADDFVIGFAREDDARRVMDALPKRFGKYGLTLHPDKTRLIEFRVPRGGPGKPDDPSSTTRSFDLLGLRHFWGRTRKGNWAIFRKTAADRLSRAVHAIAHWCRDNRHRPVSEQWRMLCQKVRGHYGYYGLPANWSRLSAFLRAVGAAWHKWLNRRSSRRWLTWPRWQALLQRFPLPPPPQALQA
jgi:RNA-directed DNA polymerase